MSRPWTGKAPLKKSKKNISVFDSFNPPPPGMKSVKHVDMPGPYKLGKYPKHGKTREEILGEPLTKAEVRMLIKPHMSHNRQVNLGRDGLTHNMLELIHSNWKRHRVCKVKCKGVPTVDMDNICHHVEELVPCILLSFNDEQILMWRGKDWKSMYPDAPSSLSDMSTLSTSDALGTENDGIHRPVTKKVVSMSRLVLLWKRALKLNKALLLDDVELGPDALLDKVDAFEEMAQATHHSFPAVILAAEEGDISSETNHRDSFQGEVSHSDDENISDIDDDEYYDSDLSEGIDSSVPLGLLPVDSIVEKLHWE